MFTKDRVLECLKGVRDTRVFDDMYIEPKPLIDDAHRLVAQKKHVWYAIPAPDALGITDCYYNDKDEWYDAIYCVYTDLMRAQRDPVLRGMCLLARGWMKLRSHHWLRIRFFLPATAGQAES